VSSVSRRLIGALLKNLLVISQTAIPTISLQTRLWVVAVVPIATDGTYTVAISDAIHVSTAANLIVKSSVPFTVAIVCI
jgi:hypothetical protein